MLAMLADTKFAVEKLAVLVTLRLRRFMVVTLAVAMLAVTRFALEMFA